MQPLLTIEQLKLTIKNKKILDNINLTLRPGETLGIIGDNGSGKSSLLRTITGIYPHTSGTIKKPENIISLLDKQMGFDKQASVRSNISYALLLHKVKQKPSAADIQSILTLAELEARAHEPLNTLSLGMQLCLSLSIALYTWTELLILDEAFSELSSTHYLKFKKAIRQKKTSRGLIIVSHQIDTIQDFCDQIIWLKNGKIYRQGDCRAILEEYAQ